MKRVSHTVKVIAPRYELPKLSSPMDGVDFDEKTGRWFSIYFQDGKVRYKLFVSDFAQSCRKRNALWANWRRKGIAFDSIHRTYGQRKARRRPVLTPCSIRSHGVTRHFGSIAQRDAWIRRRVHTDHIELIPIEPFKLTKCRACKGQAVVEFNDETKDCPTCSGTGKVRTPIKPKK